MDDFWKRCEEILGARETLSLRAKVMRNEMTELEVRTQLLTKSGEPLKNRLRAAGVRLSTPPTARAAEVTFTKRTGMTAQELTQIENKILNDLETCKWLDENKNIKLVDLNEIFELAQLGIAARNRGAQ